MPEQTQDIAEQALLIAAEESNPRASRKAFDDAPAKEEPNEK